MKKGETMEDLLGKLGCIILLMVGGYAYTIYLPKKIKERKELIVDED